MVRKVRPRFSVNSSPTSESEERFDKSTLIYLLFGAEVPWDLDLESWVVRGGSAIFYGFGGRGQQLGIGASNGPSARSHLQ